jgi:hypothetical protein
MAFVRNVDKGFFPLDKELELLPGILTPYGHECLARLAGWLPFEKAAEMFEAFTEIQISKSISQRYTEEVGATYERMQTKEVECLEREMPEAPGGADKLQVSADGAMVPLVHGQWAEVRTVVIGEVQPSVEERGEKVVHTRNLSYFSRKVNAEEFTRLALVEIQRRGVENAQQVGAVMDGAEWEQGFIDYHCPGAVRILDFPHAGEHITPIGEFVWGEGTSEMKQWLSERLHQLKHAGPTELLAEIRDLQNQHPDEKVIVGNLAYLEKRESQMQYPQFQAQGLPIGSGIVESGNKLVVEARLKGSGMHWADEHVNPMLAIRNILCSDRWKEEWPKIAAQIRQQAAERRYKLHQARVKAKAAPLAASELSPSLPVINDTSNQVPVEPNAPITPQKPKVNPWRKFKYGRSLYEPHDLPKN